MCKNAHFALTSAYMHDIMGSDKEDMMKEAIGKELKIIRIRNDLTLERVAKDLGVNKETVRRYENNSNGLSVEKLEQLLSYYNYDKSIFFENVRENMHRED